MLLRAATRVSTRTPRSTFRAAAGLPQWSRFYAKDDKPHRAVPKSPSHLRASEASVSESPTGPTQNRTWAPDRPIKFAPPSEPVTPPEYGTILDNEAVPGAAIGQDAKAVAKESTQELKRSPPPLSAVVELNESAGAISSNTRPETDRHNRQSPIVIPPLPTSLASEIPSGQENSTFAQTGQSHSDAQSAPRSTFAHENDPVAQTEAKNDATVPLPDLRQGIPSSFTNEQVAPESEPARPLPDLRQGIPSSLDYEPSDRSSSFQTREGEPPSLDITEDPTRGGGPHGRDNPEDYYTSIDRRRNAIAYWAYIAFGTFAVSGVFLLGQNWSNEEAKLHPDAPNGWEPKSIYARIKERLAPTLGYYTEPTFPKLLPDVDPSLRLSPYTLVLSLEDLLVSSTWNRQKGWTVAKRPGVDYFIRYMQQYYELALFTTVQSMNAETVYKKLDPYSFISWPLFREATRYMNGEHVKDLSYLNRDLSKVIIIDTVPAHVQLQPENAIVLPKWDGTPNDPHGNDLVALIPFLEYIASMSIDDVRKVLKSYEGKHIPTEFHRREQLARDAFNKKLAEEKRGSGRSVWGSLSAGLGLKPAAPVMQVPGEQHPVEAASQGKTLGDQIRERGLRAYDDLDKQIQLHGKEWLAEREREEKKMQEEQMRSMQSGMTGMFGGWFGGSANAGEEKS